MMTTAIGSSSDAFWRLRTSRIDTGWRVAYVENSGRERPVGAIEVEGDRYTVWFGDCDSFAVTLHSFDSAIDCLRDYVDASQLGLTE